MAGHRKFSELRDRMTPEHRAEMDARTRAMLTELPLQELRLARQLSQETLAESLGIDQSGVSKLERRADLYVSTLRRYVEAMGGSLEIVARFPDGEVRIGGLGEIAGAEGL
jgi:DNA-binding Xre family transcriptional regulator